MTLTATDPELDIRLDLAATSDLRASKKARKALEQHGVLTVPYSNYRPEVDGEVRIHRWTRKRRHDAPADELMRLPRCDGIECGTSLVQFLSTADGVCVCQVSVSLPPA
jgi:hypothetical protein